MMKEALKNDEDTREWGEAIVFIFRNFLKGTFAWRLGGGKGKFLVRSNFHSLRSLFKRRLDSLMSSF